MKKRILAVWILLAVIFSVQPFWTIQEACGYNKPWDQGHDSTNPDDPDDPEDPDDEDPCESSACPIFVANGNYSITNTDIKINSRLGFDITRTYNSLDDKRTGLVGFGWVLNVESKLLRVAGEDENYVIVLMANGQRLRFIKNIDGTYETPAGRTVQLTQKSDNEFLLQLNSDTFLLYDEHLKKILDNNGNELSLKYTDGCLSSISDENGVVLSFTKGPNGKIASISYPNGDSIFYGYDSSGNLISFTDLMGNTTTYEYDNYHNLTRVIDANGITVAQIGYGSDGKVSSYTEKGETCNFNYINSYTTRKIDSNGNAWIYIFDDNGLVTSVTDPLGNTTQRIFNEYKNLVKQVDANGNITQYDYDEQGNVVKIINALGYEKNMLYNGYGNLVQESDANGVTTRYEYDANNNLIVVHKGDGTGEEIVERMEYDEFGNKTKFVNGDGNEFKYTYDSNGHLLTESDPLGQVTSYAHDEYGNVTSKTMPDGGTWRYEYDKAGNLTKTTDPLGNTIFHEYDLHNNIVKTTDEIGSITIFEYDAHDNQFRITDPLGQQIVKTYNSRHQIESLRNKNGNFTFFQYDAVGRLVSKIVKIGDAGTTADEDDFLVDYEYDKVGNSVGVKDSYGNKIVKTYDGLNRLISETNPVGEQKTYSYDGVGNISKATLPSSLEIINTYDVHRRLVSISDSVGSIASFNYDNTGRRLARTDSLGNTSNFEYDAAGRQISTARPGGGKVLYSYNSMGGISMKTEPNGNTVSFMYDAFGRTVSMSESGRTFGAEYDAKGRKISFTDANGNKTTYSYDQNGDLLTETFSDGTSEQNSYDAEGRLIAKIDRNGNTILYQYNEIGHLVKRDYPGSNDDMFQYDKNGRLIVAQNTYSTITFSYDSAGRLLEEKQNGIPVSYNYSNNSQVKEIAYPSGETIREIRDGRYRLTRIEDDFASEIASYTFDYENKLAKKMLGNGIVSDYAYNADGKLSSISYSGEDENYQYGYDGNGNRVWLRKTQNPSNSEQYHYDNWNRLIEFKRGDLNNDQTIVSPFEKIDYALDFMSNWNSVTRNGMVSNRSHNSLNQITAIGEYELNYDGNGNLIEDREYLYEYNYKNLLTKVIKRSDGNIVSEYTYDALGRRISKFINGIKIEFYYDSDKVIEEHIDGATTATYVYGIRRDEVVRMTRSGQAYYYLLDGLGNVSKITDSSGNIVESYIYNPYGKMSIYDGLGNILSDSAVGNIYYFTGRRYDKEAGLYYYRARYYNPDLGRFLNRDPSGYADSMNLYEYAMSNPVIYIDPLGLASKTKGCFTQSLDVDIGKKFCSKLPCGLGKKIKKIKLAHTTEFCRVCCGKETARPGSIVTDVSLSGSATAGISIGPLPVPGWGVAVGDWYVGLVGFLTASGGGKISAETDKCNNDVRGSGCIIIAIGIRAEFGTDIEVVAAYILGGVTGKYKGCLEATLASIVLKHNVCLSGNIDAVIRFLYWEIKKNIYGIEKCWPLGQIKLA